jgi:hypothetical protein
MDYKRSARQEATHFVVKNKLPGGQPDQDHLSLSSKLVLKFDTQDIHRLLKWLSNVLSYKSCLDILFGS